AFDSKPRASSQPIGGARAFPTLQRVAAGIDYSVSETNYTLGISTLAAGLNRRSLIIVFTEFADTISAELMLAAVGALLERHLVLFVVLRDEELEAFTAAEPQAPEDVSRTVTAAGLLRERPRRRGSARPAGPLPGRPLLALGGAGDFARPGAGQLSGGAQRPRLFLRLWRADAALEPDRCLLRPRLAAGDAQPLARDPGLA